MESVRSEFSDSSSALGSSRHGATASSRGLTTRSDFLSNYEHTFLARKAEKKKKREREKRLADATSNQLTADDKRRADRENERRARKAEMATWLPTPAALERLERERKRRRREMLRGVLRWYPPLDEGDDGASTTTSSEQRKRHTEIQPLFAPDAPLAREAQRAETQLALQSQLQRDTAALQRRVAELQQKMGCVERLQHAVASPPSNANARARRATTLAPLHVAPHDRSLRGSRAISMSYFFRDSPEEASAALAAETAELDAFLDSHKRQRRRDAAARTLQATWRMVRQRRRYRRWRRWRTRTRRAFFQVWALAHRLARQAQRAAKRRTWRAWREAVDGAIALRLIELRLFRDAETQPELPKLVMNLVLTADDDDDAYTRKVLANPMRPSYYAGFVNAAFASVEQLESMSSSGNRVRLLGAQHLEARRAVAKKIGQRAFLLWKRVHADDRRVGLNAQLCIKRAARLAFQHRATWPREKLLTVFELWARWAAFARAKRLRVPMPHFAAPLPLWDVWLHNYQERQVRQVKAAAKAPLARMRRCFRGFRAFAALARHKRLARERAARLFRWTATHAVLLAWRDAIADSAARKKLARAVLAAWRRYAHDKARRRPWRHEVAARRLRRERQRAWGAWRNVQLRSCFKRELHRARLASQPAWRWRVQRVLLAWMDIRSQLRKWRVFVAWQHAVRRRKLFLTLRVHCAALRRRHLLYGVFGAWKAVVWKQEDEFLEDRLQLSAWDAYKELSPLVPMLFYGSFSDAAAIFAGVRTRSADGGELNGHAGALAARQLELRAFHAALQQASVVEARNLILRQRHLVNGVDDATGNTALHVAAGQLEDAVRRLEITTLLLSEGACSYAAPNRHGLTPAQLAPDDATRRLLERGVYAFHADGILTRRRRQPANESAASGLAEARLVWCLVALMASEYVRGERLAGDVRREWHSVLKDELWLRQGRVCFASASAFSPAIQRCRAFLHGMKRRICRSKDDVLAELWTRHYHRQQPQQQHHHHHPRGGDGGRGEGRGLHAASSARPALIKSATRRMLSRDLARMEEKIDLLSWLKHTPDDPTRAVQKETEEREEEAEQASARAKARLLGEYGAYAESLLWPVLHDEAAEQALVHSFVGVLFSLALPLDDVWAEALRLEDECVRLEGDVLGGYQAIMRAELRCRSPELPAGLPLLRYFTECADAEFFFKRELLLLNAELLRRRRSRGSVDDDGGESGEDEAPAPPADATARGGVAELQLEADVLLAKAQRKQRKVDKKTAAAELTVAQLNEMYTRVMLRQEQLTPTPTPTADSSSRVREICDARVRLENERLRFASLRLKQLEWAATIEELVELKRSLDAADGDGDGGGDGCRDDAGGGVTIGADGDVSDGDLLERRGFLEAQLKLHVQALKMSSSTTKSGGGGAPLDAQLPPTTALRRLHKSAASALWALFVMNLFRSCCCWLAENLLKQQREADDDGDGDAECAEADDDASTPNETASRQRSEWPLAAAAAGAVADPVSSAVASTFAAARKASAAAHAAPLEPGGGKRRSSLTNARAVLDTAQRTAAAAELAEIHTNLMRETYAGSSQLLFESDRNALLADEELARAREAEQQFGSRPGAKLAAVMELNPVTGRQETPPSRLMDADEVAAAATRAVDEGSASSAAKKAQSKSKKREQLRQAIVQRQLQRLARRQQHEEGGAAQIDQTPTPTSSSPRPAVSSKRPSLNDGVVRGDVDVGFGNFVVGHAPLALHRQLHAPAAVHSHAGGRVVAAAMAESLWKRAGAVRRQGESAPAAASAASSPSTSPAKGSHSELFASPEDELAFNTAFRVMSASKERRATPGSRRLSAIGVITGSGLRSALSPRDGDPFEMHAEASVGRSSSASPQEHESAEPPNGSEAAIAESSSDDSAFRVLTSSDSVAAPVELPDLASVVTPSEEAEFFDTTLQQYLARVRRDSLVASSPGANSSSSTQPTAPSLVDAPVRHPVASDQDAAGAGEGDNAALIVEVGDAAVDVSDARLRTPYIKWENGGDPPVQSSGDGRGARSLHVESTRLLLPHTAAASDDAGDDAPSQETVVLQNVLRELELRQLEEQQRAQQMREKRQLLLSGTSFVMGERRRKPSVAAVSQRKPPRRTSDTTQASAATETESTDQRMQTDERQRRERSHDEMPRSPSVPKVLVAIQRRESGGRNAPVPLAAPNAEQQPAIALARKASLPMALCEVGVEGSDATVAKPKLKASATKRQVGQPETSEAANAARRKSSRVPAVPVELCLEGARTQAAAAGGDASGMGGATGAWRVDQQALLVPELTEEQKRSVWREFSTAPFTDAMQDAYAQLYPHLYEPATPPLAADVAAHRRASSQRLMDASPPTAAMDAEPLEKQIEISRRFWSAVEGYKAVGAGPTLVSLDEKTAKARRVESAVAVYQQFLRPSRLAWLPMYATELRAVEKKLLVAPRGLFDALQQTAQLQISTLRAKMQQQAANGYIL